MSNYKLEGNAAVVLLVRGGNRWGSPPIRRRAEKRRVGCVPEHKPNYKPNRTNGSVNLKGGLGVRRSGSSEEGYVKCYSSSSSSSSLDID